MSVEECPHGLGEPAWCVLCNGRDAREKAAAAQEQQTVVATFTARYSGCCPRGDDIAPGHLVVRTADGQVRHHDCVEGVA